MFLVLFTILCDQKGVDRSRLGEQFGSSKNVPKSIGICPEALISHLGIIKNHKKHQTTITVPRTIQKIALFFPL